MVRRTYRHGTLPLPNLAVGPAFFLLNDQFSQHHALATKAKRPIVKAHCASSPDNLRPKPFVSSPH